MDIKAFINSMTREDFELFDKKRKEVMMVTNNDIAENFEDTSELLLNQIKLILGNEDIKNYKVQLKELGELYKQSTIMNNYNDVDSFTVDCLLSLYSQELGFPEEFFSGVQYEELTYRINDIVRSMKTVLYRKLNNHLDKTFLEKDSNLLKSNLEFFIQDIINQLNLPVFFVSLYITSIAQYSIVKNVSPIFDEDGDERK